MIVKLLILHYIADFLCQPREMGQKKSSEIKWLFGHLAIQFIVFLPFTSLAFALFNCAIHGLIDWFIWRTYKYIVSKRLYDIGNGKMGHTLVSDPGYLGQGGGEWRYWLDKMFYDTIGFDQMLHAITLVTLAKELL